jgi:hypothetical protein
VHVSDWILALWIPRMKYVVTSRVALVLPLTSAYVSESWGTQKRTQKTFKPTLFVPFRRTQKFHHNEARASETY